MFDSFQEVILEKKHRQITYGGKNGHHLSPDVTSYTPKNMQPFNNLLFFLNCKEIRS